MVARALRPLLAAALSLLAAGRALADDVDCGTLKNAYGPYDYRSEYNQVNKIPIVEGAHFQPEVESLKLGPPIYHTTYDIMGGLDYTLRAIPNHHRALATLIRFAKRGWKTDPYRTPDCYFDRAIRFAADDGSVRLLFGTYLHQKKDYKNAEKQYLAADQLMPGSMDVSYNLGLLYFDMGQRQKAKEQAISAYSRGYPLSGLRDRLVRAGLWSRSEDDQVAQALKEATSTPEQQ